MKKEEGKNKEEQEENTKEEGQERKEMERRVEGKGRKRKREMESGRERS